MSKPIYCKGEAIYLGEGHLVNFDEIFTKEFYKYSDGLAHNYKQGSVFDNELYLFFTQNYLALDYQLSKEDIGSIDVTEADESLRLYLWDFATRHDIQLIGFSGWQVYKIRAKARFQFFAAFLYLLWLMIRTKRCELATLPEKFSIVRASSTKQRILALGIDFYYEDPFQRQSVYSGYSRLRRVRWLFGAIRNARKAYTHISDSMKRFAGKGAAAIAIQFYGQRLVHTYLYAALAETILSNKAGGTFYTGNNLDRFAIIEEQLCQKYGLSLITLPHGLEYGFKLPHGFTGDQFFTTSKLAADTLNKLYGSSKFTFDSQKCDLFFKNDYQKEAGVAPQVVFFTEPREAEVNVKILDQLLPLLRDRGVRLCLKLHPKDNVSRYEHFEVTILQDIKEALHNNICFARKSTTLLEAVFNNSRAAAILLNPKDDSIFNTFTSLQIDEIVKCYDIQSLFDWIIERVEENTRRKN